MATSESKGELVIPITVVQSLLLLRRPFVPKIGHVDHRRVTVNLMTVSLQIVNMAKSTWAIFCRLIKIVTLQHHKLKKC